MELIKLGPISINSYGLMIAVGFIAAIVMGVYRAKKKGFDPNPIYDIAMWSIGGGLVGAKILYFITEFDQILADPSFLWRSLTSGFVLYGGIIGGVLAAYIYCRVRKLNFLDHFDLLIPSVALAQGLGRIGCFFAGCCYGREADHFFSLMDHGVRRIPTQLISSAGDFLIAGILILIARKQKYAGQIAQWYLLLYGVGRFIVEFWRDDARGQVGALSTSQFISIFIVLGGLLMWYVNRRRAKKDLAE